MAILALLSCVLTTTTPCAHYNHSIQSVRRDGVVPVVVGVDPTMTNPGANVLFTVTLSGEATGSETYTVSSTSGAFSSIPTQIQPEEGETQITFPATVSSTSNGTVNVSISGNGGKCGVYMAIVTSVKSGISKKS